MMQKAIVVAGPTASGKSGLALALASAFEGVVINADSMQVYQGLGILTAGPTASDLARVPHRLYGHFDPSELCSAGRWRELAAAACREAWQQGRLPVLVGGTGLYLRSLIDGLSPIPDIPEDIRAESRALFARLGNEAFHRLLAQRDPLMAARLHPANSQRLTRAFEVIAATGRSLALWQEDPPQDPLPARVLRLLLRPERAVLYAACDARFVRMIEEGAMEEVRALAARRLDPALPAMRALGVPELLDHLAGNCALGEAIGRAQQATRNYAKRQTTWFRHQMMADKIIDTQLSESLYQSIFSLIRQFLLTATD